MPAAGLVPGDGQRDLRQRWQKEQQPSVGTGCQDTMETLHCQADRGKKCFHMPYNLQTATTETSSAFFYPSPLGIQTQLFSEITTSMSLEMWSCRARKLVLCILRQSLELFSLRACQHSHSKPPSQGTQLGCASKHPNRVLATCSHTFFFKKASTTSNSLQRL